MWRLRKLRCLFPACYDITWCLKLFLWLITARGSITLCLCVCACAYGCVCVCVCVNTGKNILWCKFACVNLNMCFPPEMYQVLGGSWEWVLALVSLTQRWCVETCISDRPSSFLSGWPTASPHPARLGRVSELAPGVLGGRTRCTGRDGGLVRPPFLFQLCK